LRTDGSAAGTLGCGNFNEDVEMKPATHRMPSETATKSAPLLRWSAFAIGMMLVSGIAAAASTDLADAQALYQKERAFCLSGKSHQDQTTCLKEAGAALAEARRGTLSNGAGQFEQNQRQRCDAHQDPDERSDCLRRMNGEGTISGSVESGGFYRELRTMVPAK
jgi:hypothetical protein